MTAFEVQLDGRAERELSRLSSQLQRRIRHALVALAMDPMTPRSGCDIRQLRGEHELRALRVGDYRVLCYIVGGTVRIVTIAHRRVAYR